MIESRCGIDCSAPKIKRRDFRKDRGNRSMPYVVISNSYDVIGFVMSKEEGKTMAILTGNPCAWIERTKFIDFAQLNNNGEIKYK